VAILDFKYSMVPLGQLALVYTIEIHGRDSQVNLSLNEHPNLFGEIAIFGGELLGLESAVGEAVTGSETEVETSIDAALMDVPETATVHVVLNHPYYSWRSGMWIDRVSLIIVGE
jgi:hypothetical protein